MKKFVVGGVIVSAIVAIVAVVSFIIAGKNDEIELS